LTLVDTISACGATPASVNYAVLGQSVAWTVSVPTPLAGGWAAKWMLSSTLTTSFSVTAVAGSVEQKCDTTVLSAAGDWTKYVTSSS